MFDVQFYPTPKDVIKKMLEPYKNSTKDDDSYRYNYNEKELILLNAVQTSLF